MPRPGPRATSGTDLWISLIANPFQTQVQANSIYAAIVWSFAVSGILFVAFCLLRPHVPTVYAPRAKYADEKHAPIPLGKSFFSWIKAIRHTKESDLVDKIGLDAVVFLRFLRMVRNLFLVLTLVACLILIPVNVVGGHTFYDQWHNVATLMKLTPQYIFGQKFWAFVACAYIFQATVCFFIWWNYRAILRLKRAYFNTHDYQASLHARTLLLTHIPEEARTDAGVARLIEQVKPTEDVPRAAIGRNVKELPGLIEEHEEAVTKLEGYLAKYLKNPNRLPPSRPTCEPSGKDRAKRGSQRVDAIDYWTDRIARLEDDIRHVRESIDQRNPMPYGFASYARIEDAHAVAFAARKKGPAGSSVFLAPKPHDMLWQNLPISRAKRRRRAIWDGFWMALLTIVFIVPNILTAVFLSDFSHLGLVWPAFMTNLVAHPTGWGIAQGIVAPLVQTLIYLIMPTIFRRIYTHAGDVSRTKRERHVTSRLYAFFVFNNLIVFSIFGSAFKFVAGVVAAKDRGIWQAILDGHLFSNIMIGLCNISTFWLTWQMQRNLGAATDLIQAWPLIWGSFQRRFMSPTPRELIKLTAPQPFDYAVYYNNFLFVATVGLCFGTLQPVIIPITAFYVAIEVWWKMYLLQYVFITKTESGGMFWRLVVNRLLFAVILCNAIIALIVGAQGIGSIEPVHNGTMLYAMVPLPFLLWWFKWYCVRSFDDKITYYTTKSTSELEAGTGAELSKKRRNERVSVRFGHPALYKKLISPMVHAKSQHLLREVYRGRLDSGPAAGDGAQHPLRAPASPGYSDIYMAEMDQSQPGKSAATTHDIRAPLPFEAVNESQMDFEHFKRRAEFRDEFGGDGELYGQPEDLSRPGTPSTYTTMSGGLGFGRAESPRPHSPGQTARARSSPALGEDAPGTIYQAGYHKPGVEPRSYSPSRDEFRQYSRERLGSVDIPDSRLHTTEIVGSSEDVELRRPLAGRESPAITPPARSQREYFTPRSDQGPSRFDENARYDLYRRGGGGYEG